LRVFCMQIHLRVLCKQRGTNIQKTYGYCHMPIHLANYHHMYLYDSKEQGNGFF